MLLRLTQYIGKYNVENMELPFSYYFVYTTKNEDESETKCYGVLLCQCQWTHLSAECISDVAGDAIVGFSGLVKHPQIRGNEQTENLHNSDIILADLTTLPNSSPQRFTYS